MIDYTCDMMISYTNLTREMLGTEILVDAYKVMQARNKRVLGVKFKMTYS